MISREHKRIGTGAKGAFVIKENEKYVLEFTGYIANISEGGMKVTVEDSDRERVLAALNDNIQITFQAFDDCNLFGTDVSMIFGGAITVVRKEDVDGTLSLGCKISNPTGPLKKYIDDLKADAFLKELR